MSSVRSHVFRAGTVAFISFVVHRLFRILALISGLLILAGAIAYIRFLYFVFTVGSAGHLQSLVAGSLLIILGVQLLIGSFFAAALVKNRQLIEEMLYRQRRALYENTTNPSLVSLRDEEGVATLAGDGQSRER